MAELSPCSSIKSTSTAHYDSDYSEEEFDTDSQKELRSLITKLDLSVTSEQIYETLLVIRSDYSNVDDPTISGNLFFNFGNQALFSVLIRALISTILFIKYF